MKTNFIVLYLALLFQVPSISISYANPDQVLFQKNELNILYVNNRSDTWPWTLSMFTSSKNELESISGKKINIKIETIGEIENSNAIHNSYVELYTKKYNDKIDIIVSRDYFNELRLLHSAIPDAPIFISSQIQHNKLDYEHIKLNAHARVVKFDPIKTVDAAISCIPRSKSIVVISGVEWFDNLLKNKTKETLGYLYKDRTVEYWTGLRFAEMEQKLKQLTSQHIIIYLCFSLDKYGNSYLPAILISKIREVSNAPIFGIADTYLQGGIVGGYIHSAKTDGIKCANMINDYLHQSPVPALQVDSIYGNYVFNWSQIKQWNIKAKNLPPNSIILNKPNQFHEQYPTLTKTLIALAVLSTFLFTVLLWFYRLKKLAFSKLKLSELKLNLSLEKSHSSIFEVNYHTGNIYFSPQLYSHLGYNPEDIPNTVEQISTLIYPDDIQRMKDELDTAYELKNKEICIQCRIKSALGELRWIEGNGTIKYKNDRHINFLGIVRDITDQKRAEESFRNYIEFSPYGVFVIDNKMTFLEINKALENITKIARNQLLSMSLTDITAEEDKYRLIKEFRKIDGCNAMHLEINTKSLASDVSNIRISAVELSPNRILGFISDITKQKNYEKDLVEKKEIAEHSDKLKSMFIHNLSHEIRTPMNGIIGFSEFLENSNIPEEKRRNYASIIIKSSKQLLRTIDNILEVSHLDSNQIETKKMQFCLNSLLKDLQSTFSYDAKAKGISLNIIHSEEERTLMLFTDQSILTKVLNQLIENAIKFTEKGSIKIGYNVHKDSVEIYVRDTGSGIEENKLDLIFERFVQEDNSIAYEKGGLGIGLSLSNAYVELIGGSIKVESKKNIGSVFKVNIPILNMEELGREKPCQHEITLDSDEYQILVVEDEAVNYTYLQTILNAKGNIRVFHASNGMKAIELCKKKQWHQHGVNGFENACNEWIRCYCTNKSHKTRTSHYCSNSIYY
ncbi:MAG: ATP-binding protein [Bacteroidales bacterium]|nr:ATP-binding protein [Bacteroidales bacterium]